jgi:MtN3 and saliva related transmembrane protein
MAAEAMIMTIALWIGSLAATLSVASFTPQAWKIIRERRTQGLSAATYGLTCAAFVLWTAYGIVRGDWAIIVPNSICLLLSALILVLILLPDRQTAALAKAIEPAADD